MVDESKVEATVDTTETKSTESQSTDKSIAEEAAEVTKTEKEETSEPLAEEGEETKEPAKTEPKAETEETPPPEAEETDGEEPEVEEDDLADVLVDRKKDGAQKRIDKLTAQLRSTQEELAVIRKQDGTEPKEKTYTDGQLRGALRNAIADGDSDLVWEIIDHKVRQSEKGLVKRYEDRERKQREDAKRNVKEWNQVRDSYDYLSDSEKPEIYSGSRRDLNLKDSNSLLRKVALALYTSEDEELFQLYHRPGGQALAVADALNAILNKKRGLKPEDKEKKHLKKRLTKERRKKSLTSGSTSVKQDAVHKVKKNLTDKERLDDYIKSRRKRQSTMTEAGLK